MTVKIIENIDEMQRYSLKARQEGKTIALVPTMGYLHEGHASLMKEGRRRADLLVTSIFVNPTQFGVNEDFSKYPRDMERDVKIAAAAGVDMILAPQAAAMYPAGYQTYVDVEKLTLPLCGTSRPGHFRGVTTVVCKLFGIVQPHLALFGRKDYQQLAVIRQMTADLNLPVDIIGMPIVRESDGLAMSSRNAYLSATERQSALCLHCGLQSAITAYDQGERSIAQLQAIITAAITKEKAVVIDYVQLLDGVTLEPVSCADGNTLAAVAVRVGNTRLIDNSILGEE